jgi:VWFA-related protein
VGNRVVINPPHFTSSQGELMEVLAAPARSGSHSPVWISIDQAVTALSSQMAGRRVVVVFSDGDDAPAETALPVKLKTLIERVRAAEVMVYSLGFVDFEPRVGREPRVIPPDPGLRELAEDSGGGYFDVTRETDLNGLFTRVAEELHRQYVMGFTPPKNDGKVHTLKVTVKKPGLTARARQTYLAPAPK